MTYIQARSPTPMITARAMSRRSRVLIVIALPRRGARPRPGWSSTRPGPLRRRRRRRGWLGDGGDLPRGLDAELLLVARLRHGRGELDARERWRVLKQGNELIRRGRLTGDLEPLLVHGERAQPGVLRQPVGQLAHDRERSRIRFLDGLHRLEQWLSLRQLGGQ